MRELTPLVIPLLAFAAPGQAHLHHSRLEGQVVDAVHAPVANAEVFVEHDGIVVAKTRSDGQGTFVCPRVPAQFVVVRVTTDTPDVGGTLIDLWGESTGFARIRTLPARKLSGTVLDDADDPVVGAWVLASPTGDPQLAHATCTGRSDENGRYELTHVAMGAVTVRAWTDKHDAAAFRGQVEGRTDETLDCVVTRDAAEWYTFQLEGATPEQCARAELHVIASRNRCQMPLPPALARPRQIEPGVWEVSGWTTWDSIHAWVVLDGAVMWPGHHIISEGVGTTRRRFAIGDEDGHIAGTVLDGDGRPVGGMRLLAQPVLRSSDAINCLRRSSVTAIDGTFSLQAMIDTGAPFALRSMSPLTVLVGNDSNPVWFVQKHLANEPWELRTRRGSTVRMHIDDRRGNPLFGVAARLWGRGRDAEMLLGVGSTRLDGMAEIACLALELAAELTIQVDSADGTGTFPATLPRGTDGYLGRFTVEPAASIRGMVTLGDGDPAAGVRVQVMNMRRGIHQPFTVVTDRDGRFRQPGLGAGNYNVSCSGADESVTLAAGEESEVELSYVR